MATSEQTTTPASSTDPERSASRIRGVEPRSIDYVPLVERHGKVWHLGPVWLMGTAHLSSVAIGLVGIAAGLNLFWSVVATVLGAAFGTFFSAFHSTQGPQLGLPQMIQSRPQFGYRGALVIWAFVFVSYVGYNVFNNVLAGDMLHNVFGLPTAGGFLVLTGGAVLLATVGYDLIHTATRWFSAVFLVVYATFTAGAVMRLDLPPGQLDPGSFSWVPFMIQFGVTAGYLISWAPYVSDYSRYLPPTVGVRASFLWTYLGMMVGAVWLLALGALVGAAYPSLGVVEAVRAAGDEVLPGFGLIVLLAGFPGLVCVAALNIYGGSLTLLSILDSLVGVQATKTARLGAVAAVAVGAFLLAFTASENFLTDFTTFLTYLLYTFIPWTAVNLVDFYLVRRGHYSIREIFNPRGIYGRWSWRGLTAYTIGLVAMVPFFSTTPFTGPIAKALGGADIAAFIGLPVAAVAYLILARSLDLETERRRVEEADAGLEC
jgi:NCS1 family nucleobase:cation symporter-1